MDTEAGKKNIAALRAAGIDNLVMHVNTRTMSKLCRETFVRFGDPFAPWVVGIYSFPLRVAKAYGVSLVVYAECGEVMFGGDLNTSDKELDLGFVNKVAKTGSVKGWKDPSSWIEFGFTKSDVSPFVVPEDLSGIKAVFYAYYHKWGALHNFEQAQKIGFRPMEGRMLGTYQGYSSIDDVIDGLYMYLMYLKFGFARCTKDACKEIREGKLSREEAIRLVGRFDGEFPYAKKDFKVLLKYLDMSAPELWEICRKFVNPAIWKPCGKNKWINSENVILKMPNWRNV